AAVALGVPVADLASVADSLTFCLSKGLSCPVGSVVVGPKDFVARARRARKMLGGGLRQAGVLAAAGLVALETMVDRLADDHANAKRLAEGLAGLPGVEIDPAAIETNIVYAELTDGRGPETSAALKERGILANGRFNWVRFVTRRSITAEDIDEALDVIASVMRDRAGVR
ncbi:MAG: beta-eliminating lyase-related protein, partial [Dehalococcoidia bacterium]